MIWAPRYSDSFIENPEIEPVEAVSLADGTILTFPVLQPTIVAFGPQPASQASMLRRLLEVTLEASPIGLWLDCDTEFLTGFLPRSLHGLSYQADGPGWAIREGTLTLVSNSKGDRLALQGLPTEEGLDFLVNFAQS